MQFDIVITFFCSEWSICIATIDHTKYEHGLIHLDIIMNISGGNSVSVLLSEQYKEAVLFLFCFPQK